MFGFENVFGKKAEKPEAQSTGDDLARYVELAAADLSPEDVGLFRFVSQESGRFLSAQKK